MAMAARILVNYKEYIRLQELDHKYSELQKEIKKYRESNIQQGLGPEPNNVVNFEEPDEAIQPSPPLAIEAPPLADPGVIEKTIDYSDIPLTHIRKQFRARAQKLIQRLKLVSKNDIDVLPDYRVKLNGKLIEHSHLSDLIASLYYPKKRVAGKEEWREKLENLKLIRRKKSTTVPEEKTSSNQWWYIGE